MSDIKADNPKAFAYGVLTNMRNSYRGGLELTSKNMFPDPAFGEFEGDGDLSYWGVFNVAPIKRGRNFYLRKRGGKLTRQNEERIGLHRHSYLQDSPIINGAEPPGRRALTYVRKAAAPILEAKADDVRGYGAGTYMNGFCWVIGPPDKPAQRRLTTPSPASDPFTLTEGQTYTQPLPQRVPHEAVTGIAIVMTTPGGAYPASCYVQEIIDIRRYMKSSHVMRGPLRRKTKPPTNNETYIGAQNAYAPVRAHFGRSPHKQDFTVHHLLCGWQFMTDVGWSAIQQTRTFDYNTVRKNTALWIRPRRVPRLATKWRIAIKMKGGNWQTSNYHGQGADDGRLRLKTWFPLIASNPDKWYKRQSLIGISDIYEDQTGVEAPEEQLEPPDLTTIPARIAPGTYDGFITDVYDEGESRLSDRTRVTLTSGQNLLVRFRDPVTRRHGNVLPNIDTAERKPNGDPLYWTRNLPTVITAGDDNDWEIRQPAGPTTQQIFATLDGTYPVDNTLPYSFRFYVNMLRYVNGAAGYRIQAKNSGGTVVSSILSTRTTTGLNEITIGPTGSGADLILGSTVTQLDFVVVGTATNTAVNFDADIRGSGMFVGYARPRLRVHDQSVRRSTTLDAGPVPTAEDYTLAYPEGAYGAIVADYAGAGINAWEHYAPYDTLLNQSALPQDFEVSVDENTQYTMQCTVEGQGLPAGVELYGGVFLDENGDQLDESVAPPPITFAVDAFGNTTGVKSVTFTTPAGARTWRCTYHTTGRGLLVISKPQLEKGATATTWTNAYLSPGQVDQIFEVWCPGAAPTARKGGMLSVVRSFLEIVARADDPANTTVTAMVRFKDRLNDPTSNWSAWYTDPAQVDWIAVKRYAHVRVVCSTTDLLVSPELYEYGVRVERQGQVLLRKNGSEFYGGIEITKMPALNYPANEEERRNRRGDPDFLELFSWKDNEQIEGLELQAYRRRGVEQAHKEAARGDRVFEANYRGTELRLRILDLKFEPELPEERDGFGQWVAKDVKAQVINVRSLA